MLCELQDFSEGKSPSSQRRDRNPLCGFRIFFPSLQDQITELTAHGSLELLNRRRKKAMHRTKRSVRSKVRQGWETFE